MFTMAGLWGALGFLKDNIKWVAIILMTTTIAIGAVKVRNLIEANAQNKLVITQLEQEVKNRDMVIKLKDEQIKIIDIVIRDRDKLIEEIEAAVGGVTDNLPADENDVAPLSTKEFMSRLQGATK